MSYKMAVDVNGKEVDLIISKMTGKLQGIYAINSNPVTNKYCNKMRDSKACTVCKKCYAFRSVKRYNNAGSAWEKNSFILSTCLIKDEDIPVFRGRDLVRINAHGEIINKIHAQNIDRIIEKNPNTQFAWWTKRDDLLKGLTKRDNCIYILSSSILNKVRKSSKHFDFDKIFTVHEKNTRQEINCSGKSCVNCKLCYSKNDIKYIHEKIK